MLGKIVLTMLLAIASLFAAWQIALQVLPQTEGAEGLPARAGDILRYTNARDKTPPRVTLARLRDELILAPLEDYPLAIAGVALVKAGDRPRAKAAAEAVLRRNPRNIWGRTTTVVEAASAGDPAGAVQQISALIILDRQSADRYVHAMASLAPDARARPAIIGLLRQEPFWADAFVREMVATRPEDPFTTEVVDLTPTAQEAALTRTIQLRGYERGLLDWISFLPNQSARLTWPYDGGFKGAKGAPPFNWKFDRYNSELIPGGGLYVKFFGRRSADLAKQAMLIGPGAYRLVSDMSGELRPRGSYFRWLITCVEGAGSVASLDIDRLAERPTRWTTEFVVPNTGCSTQQLTLQGIAGELPLPARASVGRVVIEPRGPVHP